MPLQNRVDPFSKIHAVPERGMFTGNRGILHDPKTQTLRKTTWAAPAWIICTLAPIPGYSKRDRLMSKGRWTELFFLDEATALAAGHRPCYACRKEAAIAFRDAAGCRSLGALNPLLADEMKPRTRMRQPTDLEVCNPSQLPDGAMYALGHQAYLKWQDAGLPWSFMGYGSPERLPETAMRLTPRLTCKALENGFAPVLHKSFKP